VGGVGRGLLSVLGGCATRQRSLSAWLQRASAGKEGVAPPPPLTHHSSTHPPTSCIRLELLPRKLWEHAVRDVRAHCGMGWGALFAWHLLRAPASPLGPCFRHVDVRPHHAPHPILLALHSTGAGTPIACTHTHTHSHTGTHARIHARTHPHPTPHTPPTHTPCFAPALASTAWHSMSVPPDCTRSSTMTTCRPSGLPSLICTMRLSPSRTLVQITCARMGVRRAAWLRVEFGWGLDHPQLGRCHQLRGVLLWVVSRAGGVQSGCRQRRQTRWCGCQVPSWLRPLPMREGVARTTAGRD